MTAHFVCIGSAQLNRERFVRLRTHSDGFFKGGINEINVIVKFHRDGKTQVIDSWIINKEYKGIFDFPLSTIQCQIVTWLNFRIPSKFPFIVGWKLCLADWKESKKQNRQQQPGGSSHDRSPRISRRLRFANTRTIDFRYLGGKAVLLTGLIDFMIASES